MQRHKELRLKVESSGGRSGSEEEQLFSQGPGLQKRIGRLMDLYLDGKVEKDSKLPAGKWQRSVPFLLRITGVWRGVYKRMRHKSLKQRARDIKARRNVLGR